MAQYLTSKDSGAPRIDPLEVSKPLSELYRKSVAKIEAILSNDRLQSEHHAIAIRLDNALLRLRHWEHDIRLAEGVLGVVEEDHPYLARADGFLLKDMLTRLSVLYNLLLVEYGRDPDTVRASIADVEYAVSTLTSQTEPYTLALDLRNGTGTVTKLRAKLKEVELSLSKASSKPQMSAIRKPSASAPSHKVHFDLLERRKDCFVLWIPGGSAVPRLILGTFKNGEVTDLVDQDLSQSEQDLWELSPGDIQLKAGIYHYWFEVRNTEPGTSGNIKVTDPLAYTVDYRIFDKIDDDIQPPAVIKYRDGKLWPCDIDGIEPISIPTRSLPANNYMVIYELPMLWAKSGEYGEQVDRGTFTDVLALFDKSTNGLNFASISAIRDEAILADLGINALELMPIADSKSAGEWGYATAHYFSPDTDLGSSASLLQLIKNTSGRLILDTVLACGLDSYAQIAFDHFHLVAYNPDNPSPFAQPANPDSYTSHSQEWRKSYGGKLWQYVQTTTTYNPETGMVSTVHPSWSFHKAHLHRWLSDFGVSGIRLDDINNIANYEFIKNYSDFARHSYEGAANEFIVIGAGTSVSKDLLKLGAVDALWNEDFKIRLRSVLLGESTGGDHFVYTVRKMIDCTQDGFENGAQAVNYLTSHEVEGYRNERLYNFLQNNNVIDIEARAKLAFVCLLTAVGIPMIFAGEEFCDQMKLVVEGQQTDPVNYQRKDEEWRGRVFDYVATLVRFRQDCPALGVDGTSFIHVDNSRDGKILAWERGTSYPIAPVVVVANFTDQETSGNEYYIPNWPARYRNDWREITQHRSVSAEWVGREPLMPWEAKVYTYWRA